MYKRPQRNKQTNLWCEHCGRRLTEFEILLGCLNCTGNYKPPMYPDKSITAKMLANDGFIRLTAYKAGKSVAWVREQIALGNMTLYDDMYKKFKELNLHIPKKSRN